jgi:hypothetical protein
MDFIRRRAGTVRLDLEALPERKHDEGKERHSEREHDPLFEAHGGTFNGGKL